MPKLIPVNTQHSRYGTFNSDTSISFIDAKAPMSNIYRFGCDAMEVLSSLYPDAYSLDSKKRKDAALQISKDLRDFSQYIGADISIIYDATENTFLIVLRDPENIGNSFLTNFSSNKRRSYIDAQLNVVAAFLLDKQANLSHELKCTGSNHYIG